MYPHSVLIVESLVGNITRREVRGEDSIETLTRPAMRRDLNVVLQRDLLQFSSSLPSAQSGVPEQWRNPGMHVLSRQRNWSDRHVVLWHRCGASSDPSAQSTLPSHTHDCMTQWLWSSHSNSEERHCDDLVDSAQPFKLIIIICIVLYVLCMHIGTGRDAIRIP